MNDLDTRSLTRASAELSLILKISVVNNLLTIRHKHS
jgi:hypothetical protein